MWFRNRYDHILKVIAVIRLVLNEFFFYYSLIQFLIIQLLIDINATKRSFYCGINGRNVEIDILQLITLMCQCWSSSPEARPKLQDIRQTIGSIFSSS